MTFVSLLHRDFAWTPAVGVRFKRATLTTASATALLLASAAFQSEAFAAQAGQTAADTQASQVPETEEVVVTGTRIVRDGYQAPTPVTVVGVEQLQANPTDNIADFVNTMPEFAGSTTVASSQTTFGTSGLNALNLRGLGTTRTLVLLDGQRSVGINTSQTVDINLLPQSLISRVDVVTGGASAAYGSDALAGVVNFVLDKTFTGIKGEVAGGVTTYGDDRNWSVNLTGGTGFADDKGHFLINGSASHDDGVPVNNRPWAFSGFQFMTNPAYTATNGQPQLLQLNHVSPDNGFAGGSIITSGPLKGIAFGTGGVPYQYQYGSLTFDPDTYNSPDFAATQCRGNICAGSLLSMETTQTAFTRLSYEVSDSIEIFAQASWAHNYNTNNCCSRESSANINILSGNPFIPASIQSQMTALGVTQLVMGSQNPDLPDEIGENDRRTNRYVIGANGRLDAFDTAWTWNAYYQKGVSLQTSAVIDPVRTNFANALDAVRGPNGQIMCRSTLTNPNDGCVPYNIFGAGVNSPAAVNYVLGAGQRDFNHQHLNQDVMAASIQGEPFSTWAGPVSVATGIEHRAEHVTGINDPLSNTFGWFVGNFQVYTAGYQVTEGFVETVLPLAKDQPWARELDINGAVRATSYTTSGYVTTWKIGATYAPIDDIKFRATRSRDIRAPNIQELFNAGGGSAPGILNDFRNRESETVIGDTVGNSALTPEKSDATGAGVVLQPTFIPGFNASVDYWNMSINNAIGTLATQAIIDNCYAGNAQLCKAIIFATDGSQRITQINIEPFNLVNQIVRGIDFEASYHVGLDQIVSSWAGDVNLRWLATNYIKNYSSNGINPPTDTAGQNSGSGAVPNWRWTAAATYALDPITVGLTARGVSSGTYNNSYILCSSGCPASTTTNTTVNNNHIAGAVYFDMAITYKMTHKDQGGYDSEVFLNVRDLTNKGPVLIAPGAGGFNYSNPEYNPNLYDVLGRVFRAGVRFKM